MPSYNPIPRANAAAPLASAVIVPPLLTMLPSKVLTWIEMPVAVAASPPPIADATTVPLFVMPPAKCETVKLGLKPTPMPAAKAPPLLLAEAEIVPLLTMLALKLVTEISMPLAIATALPPVIVADAETTPLFATTPWNSAPLSSMPRAVAAPTPVADAAIVPPVLFVIPPANVVNAAAMPAAKAAPLVFVATPEIVPLLTMFPVNVLMLTASAVAVARVPLPLTIALAEIVAALPSVPENTVPVALRP